MFGRKREEDYDDYNEKYASKYDDDYIAPSKEYRSEQINDRERTYSDMTAVRECDHDHEQTYSNINTVRECEHNHEQTYEDADSEQHQYDDYASLENFFEGMLERGERLVWVGSKNNVKPSSNTGKNPKQPVGLYIMFTGIALLVAGACSPMLIIFGLLLIVAGVVSMTKSSMTAFYALTNNRVIIAGTSGTSSVALNDIIKVERSMLGKNMGNVYITTRLMYRGSQRAGSSFRLALYEINDPARVERILNDAIQGFF
ncbi:MAG: hypothetical protein K6G33_02305 [Ruminococcus sp.]|uniref:PH domain-containing protein n=1 Tax=Ruminococcus sp. TaxID=41978 RepID=UPI0025D9B74E|nr:PH domain-containing protein [Ruminococcus sp.]MCR5599562.1 hypothetical protein [Ruminococcus sp.]